MPRLAVALAVALCPLAASGGGAVRVADEVRIDGGELTLGLISHGDGLAPEESARLEAVRLGPAAGAGRSRTFSGATLRREIERALPEAQVEVPDSVRVHTRARSVTAADVQALVERAIRLRAPFPADALRFSAWTLPGDFSAPAAATRTEVSFREGEDFVGRVGVELRFREPAADDLSPLSRSAAVHVAVLRPVAVAARALGRGAVLEADALALEERDLSELPPGASTDLAALVGRRLARALGAGAVVLPDALEVERVVRRGDLLEVEASAGALALSVAARALEPGAAGQVIRAENRESRREFLVEVVAPGRARLALPAVGAGEAAR
jgi:flagella basal body P-ring formation protein FlgA